VKKILLIILIAAASFCLGWFAKGLLQSELPDNKIINISKEPETPYDKYTIENLKDANVDKGDLEIDKTIDEQDDYTSYLFKLRFSPSLDEQLKTVTGQINIPKTENDNRKYPIIVMIRGYIDQETFVTGDGTRNTAAFFAENGYITVAPDFLGYGGSDSEAGNIFEARFQTYITVVSLIKSLDQLDKWNGKDIFIWGHSNGGHIVLTVLEITGAEYPTVLWAPVSKPFPYSVLYYTDESVDGGKLIRRELSKFEELYDTDKYSLTNYFDKINAPIQLYQGTADDAVPYIWSRSMVKKLEDMDKEVDYHEYPATDHNMRPSWDEVIENSLKFYNSHLVD
jgi:dipeptidyl aminopeptidase/acylaminoacyl peptidase